MGTFVFSERITNVDDDVSSHSMGAVVEGDSPVVCWPPRSSGLVHYLVPREYPGYLRDNVHLPFSTSGAPPPESMVPVRRQ